MDAAHRSGCPINLSLEVFGDKWSLLHPARHDLRRPPAFPRLLMESRRGISSNMLADRLKTLVAMAC